MYADLVRRYLPAEEMDFAGGVLESDISSAEQALAVRFPSKFRSFLGELGCGGVDSEEFIGLGGPRHLDIVQSTNWLRERPGGFPTTLVPLRRDGFGNYDCLDVGCWTGDDCPVVEWVHDAPHADRRVLASDYERWFESIDLSPNFHPAMGRVLVTSEPIGLGGATGSSAEPVV